MNNKFTLACTQSIIILQVFLSLISDVRIKFNFVKREGMFGLDNAFRFSIWLMPFEGPGRPNGDFKRYLS